jgi:hypothetical protein
MIKYKNSAILSLFLYCLLACSGGAKNTEDAVKKLTSVKDWKIEQIWIDDVQSLKDGEITSRFGGVDFERYMETVQFKSDGTFAGVFKGESKPFNLNWKALQKDIAISADGRQEGAWSVKPSDVTSDTFTMSTQSTAYDYPRTTKIALKFRAAD